MFDLQSYSQVRSRELLDEARREQLARFVQCCRDARQSVWAKLRLPRLSRKTTIEDDSAVTICCAA